MRSRSILSCSRRCSISVWATVPKLRSSAILPPRYAVDEDGIVGCLPAGRRDAQKLPSIVGGVHGEAAHHLVCFGYLLLDGEPGVGKRGSILEAHPLVAFTVELLAGKHPSVADEVGSKHLVQRVQVQLTSCLEETAYQGLVLFSLRRHSSFLLVLLANPRSYSVVRLQHP